MQSVIVVGAGIVGAGVAYELAQAGHQVTLLADAPIGAGQSAGATRIFRLSHDAEEYVEAARHALDGWQRWESELQVELLERCGLLISGDASQRIAHLQPHEVEARSGEAHPLSALETTWAFETTGAAGQIERALRGLLAGQEIQFGRARAVSRSQVRLDDGSTLQADRVVVCAGADTHRLLGLPQPELFAYLRFSFPLRERLASTPPCWMQRDPELCSPFYALPDGPDFYALGLSEGAPAALGEAAHLADHHGRVQEIVRELLPGLVPIAMRAVRCEYPAIHDAASDDFTHDGWQLIDQDEVLAVIGPNLFKFAPYLSQLVRERLS